MKTFILIALIIVIDGTQASEECNDGYASDHKTAFVDVYGENWHEVHNWKYCDMTCGEMQAAGYCTMPWKSFYCSAIDNLKVQDTCKHSCGKCPTDCQWGEWELVGECSKTCGGGVQKQKRDKLVFEKNGGACSDASPDQMESVDCNTEPCVGDGTGIYSAEITAVTPTNWDKKAYDIRYDRAGLLGKNYGGLRLNFDFGKPTTIIGMETDYTDNPYNLRIGDTFEQIIKTATGPETLDEPITVQKIQVEWLNTGPMYKLNPNGTLGIHFEFLGQASGANCNPKAPKFIGCYLHPKKHIAEPEFKDGPSVTDSPWPLQPNRFNQETCNESCKNKYKTKYLVLRGGQRHEFSGECKCADAYATADKYVKKTFTDCDPYINGNWLGNSWRNAVFEVC